MDPAQRMMSQKKMDSLKMALCAWTQRKWNLMLVVSARVTFLSQVIFYTPLFAGGPLQKQIYGKGPGTGGVPTREVASAGPFIVTRRDG